MTKPAARLRKTAIYFACVFVYAYLFQQKGTEPAHPMLEAGSEHSEPHPASTQEQHSS